MPRQPVVPRIPWWAALLACWMWQVSPAMYRIPSAWHPELLLIVFLSLCTRWSVIRAMAVAAGISALLMVTSVQPQLVIGLYWMGAAGAVVWMRREVYVEQTHMFVLVAWILVMCWHLVLWSAGAALDEESQILWPHAMLIGQTLSTVTLGWLWHQYGLPHIVCTAS